MTEQVFSTSTVADVSGATLRQLQWWDERKVIRADQKGHSRTWTRHQFFMVLIVSSLRVRGYSLQQIRPVVLHLGRRAFHGDEILMLTGFPARDSQRRAVRTQIFNDIDQVYKAAVESLGPVCIIPFEPLYQKIAATAERMRRAARMQTTGRYEDSAIMRA